jgi:hypothetical protein
VAASADKTDSFISMVLEMKGRVRPVDLRSVPEDARAAALAAYLQAHREERELHLLEGDLIAGALPDPAVPPSAPAPFATTTPQPAAPPKPTDLTADGQSAIDLLLGDYDGAPPAPPETPAAPDAAVFGRAAAPGGLAPRSASPGTAGASSLAPSRASAAAPSAPANPGDTSRRWLLWWIPTLLVPIFGGAVAWFFLRNKRELAARAMLGVALALGLFASLLWLRYAEQIGGTIALRSTQTNIVLPGK